MVTKATSKNIVVCGGGLMGLSITYHLARRGASVMLFERDWWVLIFNVDKLTFSVGFHNESKAPKGLVTAPYFFTDATAQRMAKQSLKMYSALAQAANFSRLKTQYPDMINFKNTNNVVGSIWQEVMNPSTTSVESIHDPWFTPTRMNSLTVRVKC